MTSASDVIRVAITIFTSHKDQKSDLQFRKNLLKRVFLVHFKLQCVVNLFKFKLKLNPVFFKLEEFHRIHVYLAIFI